MLRTTIIRLGANWVMRHEKALRTVGKFTGLDWHELGVDMHMKIKPYWRAYARAALRGKGDM